MSSDVLSCLMQVTQVCFMNVFLFIKKKKKKKFKKFIYKNIFDFLKLSVNINFLLQNRSDFFYIHTKNQFFTLFQNISDIFEPKDFVLLNKTNLIFFSSPKTFFFTYTKTYLIFLRPNQFFLLQDRSKLFFKRRGYTHKQTYVTQFG